MHKRTRNSRPLEVEGTRTGRRRPGTLKEHYPVIFAFGDGPIEFLDDEAARSASLQDRIRSVWPFLVREVLKFAETLKPRALANFDPEDVLTELWIVLAEKDSKWEPERGRYLTFAGKIVANELHAIRDRSNTVHSPRNSACRIKEYESDELANGLSERRRKTLSDIRRVMGDHEPVEDNERIATGEGETIESVERREELRLISDAVRKAMMGLSAEEADVIGKSFGLWGQDPLSLEEIALRRGKGIDAAKKAKLRGQYKLRRRLEDLEHPAARDDENS